MSVLCESSVASSRDIVLVRQRAKRIAELLGLSPKDQTRLATAVSEVVREVVSSGCHGHIEFDLDESKAPPLLLARIKAIPGAKLGSDASVAPTRPPVANNEGLIAARRLVDHFHIISLNGSGSVIELGKLATIRRGMPSAEKLQRTLREEAGAASLDLNAAFNDQNRELIASLQELQDKQQELQRLNQELQDTNRGVVALYAELEEKAEQLRAASDAKSRFLANVSHEFRTPLNSILALSRLLLDHVDGALQPEQEKQVAFIRRSAETLLEFVNDLLDLAKVEAGKVDVHADAFSLPDFMRGLRGVLKPLKLTDAVELIFEECEPLSIVADEGKLAQILRNLISNALKYTERGEVRVKVAINRSRGVAIFQVRDTGIGIAERDQARIFEEFEQVLGAFQQKNKGSGLGLALSQKLARLLGGEITVESTLGVGSTFELCIPLDYAQPLGTLPPPMEQAAGLKRVLVVDDEETFRYIVRHIVASEPEYELIEARDGSEGLIRTRRDRPDVLILDLQMPVMNGHEVLRELAADPQTRNIPVIISTSLPLTAELQEEVAGAFLLLSKSNLSKDSLLDALRRALIGAPAQRVPTSSNHDSPNR
jgi:signal transduction histidine kinase/ActR/RegA family two-component response regulator